MSTLATTLRANAVTGTPDEVQSALRETVVVSQDDTSYSWSGLNRKLLDIGLPVEVVAGWDVALSAMPGGSMLARMLSDKSGVQLSHPAIQAQLTAVKSVTDDAGKQLLQALLSIGVTYGFRWQQLGLGFEPPIEDITTALQEIADQEAIEAAEQAKQDLIRDVRTLWDRAGAEAVTIAMQGGTEAESTAAGQAVIDTGIAGLAPGGGV